MEAKEIAVRLYENKKYGTTYGKGLFHSAVFNASADVLGRKTKFLLDFYPYEKFEHIAKTDEQMVVLKELGVVKTEDKLFSWVVDYDATTKAKAPVNGFCIFDMKDSRIDLIVLEDENSNHWRLKAKRCKESQGKNAPTLIATNADDLSKW
jgi:hypothetical protein